MKSSDPYYCTTYTGRRINFLEPDPFEICKEDIAHHLSLICRFNGALPEHYSVAQHCVLVSHLVPEKYALEALLHDAAEAYIGDIVRPMKRLPGLQTYIADLELRFEEAIIEHFELDRKIFYSKEIKDADTKALLIEKRDLFHAAKDHKWVESTQIADADLVAPDHIKTTFIHPGIAKAEFLKRLARLHW